MTDTTATALLESAVSLLIAYANSTTADGERLDKSSPIVRDVARRIVDEGAKNLLGRPGLNDGWNSVKGRMLYDVYLEMRKAEGTLEEYDMVRLGLLKQHFSTDDEYYKHMVRVSEARAKEPTKVCSVCGLAKPRSKFRKGMGAACNACQCKKRRERRIQAQREEASGEAQP